jgi:hypothetical protein
VAIADNDIWAVGGSNSQPLAVHFDGKNWSAVPTPTINHVATFAGVAAVASNDIWAVGYQSVGSSNDEPLIEHWDGTSWSAVSSPNLSQGGFLQAVTAISTNNVWAVGEFDNLSVDLVEHWDGTSWSVVSSPAFNGSLGVVYGVSADASNDVWAVGSGQFFGVAAAASNDAWAIGFKIGPDNPDFGLQLIEHWDGAGASSRPLPCPAEGSMVCGRTQRVSTCASLDASVPLAYPESFVRLCETIARPCVTR